MATNTNGSTKVRSPAKLAHVVLKTNQLDKMRDFYIKFLGGSEVMGNEMITFITYDDGKTSKLSL